jgi:hypothetical protein
MHPMNLIRHVTLALIQTLMVMAGCESQDRRLADYAQRATEQQARQNERMAQQSETVTRQSQELVSAAHDLVEQDAAARRELIRAQENLQQKIHEERTGVDRQREQLEVERKSAAKAAIREPLIAQSIFTIGIIVAALLPLLVTALALWRLSDQTPADELLSDGLLEGLVVGLPASAMPELPRRSLPDLSESAREDLDESDAGRGTGPGP